MNFDSKKYKCVNFLRTSDPGKILDLVMRLHEDKCCMIQANINNYLREDCEAEQVVQVVFYGDRNEASIDSVGSVCLTKKYKVLVIPKFTQILRSGMDVMEYFPDMTEDFQAIVRPYLSSENLKKKRVYMVPHTDKRYSVITCLIAPKVLEDHIALITKECFAFVWPTLIKAIGMEYEETMKTKCQQLLKMTRLLFAQVNSLESLLDIAMKQAKTLIRAEKCSVLLLDNSKNYLTETITRIRDGIEETVRRRFPVTAGLTGQVFSSGYILNVKNIKDHPKFDPNVDSPDINCRNLLIFPIREQNGLIGVGRVINKIEEPYFDAMDEELALAFSVYCGVCIAHSVVHERMQEAHIKNALANELVTYHMKVSDEEANRVINCAGFHGHPHFQSLHFNPRNLPLRELPCYGVRMFKDLGFINKFAINNVKLARFILLVKKGYRDVPYHNWLHGFNVGQWAYAAVYNFKLVQNDYFSDLQALMYLIAGFTHDLDHRGTSNSFQINDKTLLAALYSSEGSVLERHHLAQAISCLNTEGCDILENMPRKEYDRALLLLRDFIIASDLSNYFKNLNEYEELSMDYLKGNRAHINMFQSLMMNAADLSDQLKDWGSVKKTAAAVLTEFFNQGDVEKNRGEPVSEIMDREKCNIPELEIQFLRVVCIPLYTMLGRILPKAERCITILENHVTRWDGAKPTFQEVPPIAGLSVLLSPDLDQLIEAELIERERIKQEALEAERAAEAAAAAVADEEEEG